MNIYSEIIQSTEDESRKLLRLLKVDSDDVCFLKDDKFFYTGLIRYLQNNGMSIQCNNEAFGLDGIECIDERLRDYQQLAVKKALKSGRGIVQASTGAGKTHIAAGVIEGLHKAGFNKVTYIVPTGYLMQQTITKLRSLGIWCTGVGYKMRFDKTFDVQVFVAKSAVNAVYRMNDAGEFIKNSDVLIMDEVQHLASKTWVDICERCEAQFRFGFTATAFEAEEGEPYTGRDLYLMGLTGNVVINIRSKELRDKGYLAQPIVMMLSHATKSIRFLWSPRVVYKVGIVKNDSRNEKIADIAVRCKDAGHKVLIFVLHKEHGHNICKNISKELGTECLFVMGGGGTVKYKASGVTNKSIMPLDKITQYIESDGGRIIIATNVWDEGIDITDINVLIMAASLKKHRRYVQRAGRAMRPKAEHNYCYIIDLYDTNHPILEGYSKSRMRTYQLEEYDFASSVNEFETLIGVTLQ